MLEERVLSDLNPAKWKYFNYRRSNIAIRNAIVYVDLFGFETKAEYISLIYNFFLFLILQLMLWNASFTNLCDQTKFALLVLKLDDY